MNKALFSILVSTALAIAPLPAMSAAGPLAPGGAAGVKQAQGLTDTPWIWVLGIGAVVGLGILALSNNDDGSSTTPPVTPPTTTTTTTTTTNP